MSALVVCVVWSEWMAGAWVSCSTPTDSAKGFLALCCGGVANPAGRMRFVYQSGGIAKASELPETGSNGWGNSGFHPRNYGNAVATVELAPKTRQDRCVNKDGIFLGNLRVCPKK